MHANSVIQRVPASPEYILSCLQEEWRQCVTVDDERLLPTFATTVYDWREALDLVWWSPLGHALNKAWGTKFSQWQWFQVLCPAREKTLGDVCKLMASGAKRPVVKPTKLLGGECPAAAIFLAIRSLLIRAGASPHLRPSTALPGFLLRFPKLFLRQISCFAPGGLPLFYKSKFLGRCTGYLFLLGVVFLDVAGFTSRTVSHHCRSGLICDRLVWRRRPLFARVGHPQDHG